MRHRLIQFLMNVWPPLLGAGIQVAFVSPDRRTVVVAMKLGLLNRNIVGVHFGGSLYAMCDPFFMLILMEQLGKDYIVWDKAASIRFIRPGSGRVSATFHIPQVKIEEIRSAADSSRKVEPTFTVQVLDQEGTIVAEVEKLLHVRRKTPLNNA
jgi:acyl-coenzyme A thioesterase PaaI-like protein